MHLALLAALYAVAVALRYVPLTFSTMPFNVDGYPLTWVSAQIGATGSWAIHADVNRYSELMPLYPLVWSVVSQLGGVGVLSTFQAVMPAVLATVVLPAYLLGLKATRSPVAAFASGLFIAAFGSFLFLTSAAMKEALGLLVLPTVIVLFAERADPRKRALALVLLLLMPFLSQLEDLLVLGMVAALVVLTHSRAISRGVFSARTLLLDCGTGPALALLAYVYYAVVAMPDLNAVVAPDALALFLATVTLLTALLVRLRRVTWPGPGERLVRPAGPILLVPFLALAAILVNGRTELFAGVLPTQPALEPVLLAAAVLVALAFLGYQLVRRTTNRAGDVLFAMAASPLALVVFSFLRGLDGLSQVLVYRRFDFLDYALAVLVGIGFAYAWRRLHPSNAARLALGATLVVVLLATTPMAYNSQAVFGVNEVTTPSEFQAFSVLASLHPRNVTTDGRLGYIAMDWYGMNVSETLPYLLARNESTAAYAYAVVEEGWTTVGAQVHPAPNVVIPARTLEAFLAANRVVYAAGPAGDRVYVVQMVGR